MGGKPCDVILCFMNQQKRANRTIVSHTKNKQTNKTTRPVTTLYKILIILPECWIWCHVPLAFGQVAYSIPSCSVT